MKTWWERGFQRKTKHYSLGLKLIGCPICTDLKNVTIVKLWHISAKCFFNSKSKNFEDEGEHTTNGKNTNPCSEKETAMIDQTCALVSNRGLSLSEKRTLDSACASQICNQRQHFKIFTEKRSEIIVRNKKVAIWGRFWQPQYSINWKWYWLHNRAARCTVHS